jgi:GT2 family glycosyltransferase
MGKTSKNMEELEIKPDLKAALSSYRERIALNSFPEGEFLNRTPWCLDVQRQDITALTKALIRESESFNEWEGKLPLFSLITPMWNTIPNYLEDVIMSCRCQSWQRWELILVDDASSQRDHLQIAQNWASQDSRIRICELEQNLGISGARNIAFSEALGDYVCFLDHDDILHPQALGTYAKHLVTEKEIDFIFSNEAKIDAEGKVVSHFLSKPQFDLFTLLRVNYVCHFTAIKMELLEKVCAQRKTLFNPEFDGCEDHDLFLEIAKLEPITKHIPLFLYYWRMAETSTARSIATKPKVISKAPVMLRSHAEDYYGANNFILHGADFELGNIHPKIELVGWKASVAAEIPELLVIIPFKDQVELTLRCLDSIENQEHGLNLTVVLIDNNSHLSKTKEKIESWLSQTRKNKYIVHPDFGSFNYARLNNSAFKKYGANSDLILFLNNDVELVSKNCLQTMATQCLVDSRTAFVGIRLMYPNSNEIQHGGVAVVPGLSLSGLYSIGHCKHQEDFVMIDRITTGVTFACAMTRKRLFLELGCLEEILIPNGFGDVDICLRALSHGYVNRYFGTVWGIHHESKTRGFTVEEFEFHTLNARNAEIINRSRLQHLGYNLQLNWTYLSRPELLPKTSSQANSLQVPLRYIFADRLNEVLKRYIGAHQRRLKQLLSRIFA